MAAPIKIKGLEGAIRYLSSFPGKKKQGMTEVLNAWSYRVTTAASPKSPVGVTGRLAKDASMF